MTGDDSPFATIDVENVERLAAELDETAGRGLVSFPPAPGAPLFAALHTMDPFVLATIILSEPPGPYGTELSREYESAVGQPLATGTAYPRLNDLTEGGVIEGVDFARATCYQIGDADLADQRLKQYEQRLRWWLQLCLAARDQLERDADAAD